MHACRSTLEDPTWDVASGATLVELVGHIGQVTSHVAWSADGRLVVTGALDGTARVWDADTGDLLAVIPHGQQVWAVAFSPDASRIVTAAEDGTVAIHALARYDGGADDLATLLRCRVPFEFRSDRLVARQPDRTACPRPQARDIR